MRSLLALSLCLGLVTVFGGCSKKETPAPTPAAAPATVTATNQPKRGDAEPVGCKGMTSAAACATCCDPMYWRAHFVNNQCTCIKK